MSDQTKAAVDEAAVTNAKADAAAEATQARRLLGLPLDLPIGTRIIKVASYGWPQLFDVLEASQPIFDAVAAQPDADARAVIGGMRGHVDRLICLSTGLSVDELRALSMSDGMKVAYAVWDENRDFFIREMTPVLVTRLVSKMAKSSSSETQTTSQAEAEPSPEPAGPALQTD